MLPFAPLVGQSQAVELLTQAVEKQRIAPAYLFAGPSGTGRGLAAECFIELLFNVVDSAAGSTASKMWQPYAIGFSSETIPICCG